MRALLLALIGVVGAAAFAPMAAAAPQGPSRAAVMPATSAVPIAHHCGRGWHWVPAGYAKHGKYRVGHCSPN